MSSLLSYVTRKWKEWEANKQKEIGESSVYKRARADINGQSTQVLVRITKGPLDFQCTGSARKDFTQDIKILSTMG